jgi:20S proteasome alpha/beta subunit
MRPKEKKRMTIAAGFVVQDGVLLCSDSQYSGGIKLFKKKIFPFSIDDECSVAFALDGLEGVAKMAIHDCREAIAEMPKRKRTLKSVRTALRVVVRSINKDYVSPDRDGFDLIIALWLKTEAEPKLFATSGKAVNDIYHYKCIGSGGLYLGHYLVEQSRDISEICPMITEHAFLLGSRMLTAAAMFDDGCGGLPVFWLLRKDGSFLRSEYNTIGAESHLRQAESVAQDFILNIANVRITDPVFATNCNGLSQMAQTIRSSWKATQSAWLTLDRMRPALPEELTEAAL